MADTTTNKVRKKQQKASYQSQFKPKQCPRSRPWQKGMNYDSKGKRV